MTQPSEARGADDPHLVADDEFKAATGEPIEVSVGEKILFKKYAGTEFKLDDEDLLILSQKDVLAVIK